MGQDTIRSHIRKATVVIGMATVLHTIAAGNMTPTYRVLSDGTVRPIYFYMVDTSEFAANKLGDRGSLAAKGIVDVYKRQREDYDNVKAAVEKRCKGDFGLSEVPGLDSQRRETVSYTHLDVYKRQGHSTRQRFFQGC